MKGKKMNRTEFCSKLMFDPRIESFHVTNNDSGSDIEIYYKDSDQAPAIFCNGKAIGLNDDDATNISNIDSNSEFFILPEDTSSFLRVAEKMNYTFEKEKTQSVKAIPVKKKKA